MSILAMNNYFEILNLPMQFRLELNDIDRQYFAMQLKFHPDTACDEKQKEHFMQMTIQINNAYKALRDDLARAKELLKVAGMDLDDVKYRNSIAQQDLQNIFTDAQEISDTEDGNILAAMLGQKNSQRNALVNSLASAFESNNLNQTVQDTLLLKYVDNLIKQIKQKLHKKSPH